MLDIYTSFNIYDKSSLTNNCLYIGQKTFIVKNITRQKIGNIETK